MPQNTPQKTTVRRRRCLNCGTLFTPVKGTNGPRQKFCLTNGRQCRDEYNKAGGVSFTRYKQISDSGIAKAKREILYELREILRKAGVSRELRERVNQMATPSFDPPEQSGQVN